MIDDSRARPSGTGSREPGLASRPGPSGFDPARRERPSQHGRVLGEALSDLAKAGAVGTGLLDLMCRTCAFREGCMTSQMAATGIEALNCVTGWDSADFVCHYGRKNGQPARLCAGFIAAQRVPFDVLKSTLRTLAARMDNLAPDDADRAAFDAWAAENDPDGAMDDYERSRRYSKAPAIEARRAATGNTDAVADESAVPAGQTPNHSQEHRQPPVSE